MKGTELGIWVDEFNFSSATSQVDLTFEVQEAERTNLDSVAQEFLPILPKCTVTQNGYFEGVLPDGFEAELNARFGAGTAIVTVLTQKSDANCVAYVLPEATGYSMVFSAPVANLVTLNGQWGTAAGAVRGRCLYHGTIVQDFGTSPVYMIDGSTNGGECYVHVAAVSGTTSGVQIQIVSSDDQIDWNVEATVTFADAGSTRVLLNGSVGRYMRVLFTMNGASAIRCAIVAALEPAESIRIFSGTFTHPNEYETEWGPLINVGREFTGRALINVTEIVDLQSTITLAFRAASDADATYGWQEIGGPTITGLGYYDVNLGSAVNQYIQVGCQYMGATAITCTVDVIYS